MIIKEVNTIPLTKKEYVEKAVSGIKNKTVRREVSEELDAHIDELIELWRRRGFDEAEAEEKAVEEMGAPEKTSEDLGRVYSRGAAVSAVIWFALTLLFAAVLLIFGRVTTLLIVYSLKNFFPDMAGWELAFLAPSTLTLAVGVKRKNPFLCAASAASALVFIGFYGFASYLDGAFPGSPAVLTAAIMLTGRWRELPAAANAVISVNSPALCAISVVLYLCAVAVPVVFAVFYAVKKGKYSRGQLRINKTAAVASVCVLAFLFVADASSVVRLRRETALNQEINAIDGWYLIQSDEMPDLSAIDESAVDPLSEYTDHLRYELDLFSYEIEATTGMNLYMYYDHDPEKSPEQPFDDLFSISFPVARGKLTAKKKYLLAVPEISGRLLPDRAVCFDLDREKTLRLSLGVQVEGALYVVLNVVQG